MLSSQIRPDCVWTVVDGGSNGGYIIQNTLTDSYLFESDQPWSNNVFPSSNRPSGVFCFGSWSNTYPSSIKFSLSINGSGESFLTAKSDGFNSQGFVYMSDSNNSGSNWYAYEVNPNEDVAFTQHKVCIPYSGPYSGYFLSFIKPVSNVVFTSSNPEIVYIYPSGEINAKGTGTTTITATNGEKTDTCNITIFPTASNELEIDNLRYHINENLDGVSIFHPSSHNDASIESLEIPDAIDLNGYLYPVTIIGGYVLSSSYYYLTDYLILGKNIRFIGSYAFSEQNNINVVISKNPYPPTCDNTTFYSWNKNAILMVPAEAIPAYSATKPWNEFKEIRSIEPLSAIAFAEPTVICSLNGTVQLKIDKTPMYASGDISYMSSNPAIASVDANGIVTGHALGSTAIIAMSGTLVASCIVNVENPLPPVLSAESIEMEAIVGKVGENIDLTASVGP